MFWLSDCLSDSQMSCTYSSLIDLQVASHPNIYVLDTPGVLLPRFANDGSGPRLALTGTSYFKVYGFNLTTYYYLMHAHAFAGAIKDSLLEEYDIVQFLLAIVNSGKEYRKWENLNKAGDNFSCGNTIRSMGQNNKRQSASDHTQVSAARRSVR
jgi:ribosome biogenesis GTPase A